MTELMAQNKSLRIDPLSLYMSSVFTKLVVLSGMHPKMWDAGKIATADTVCKALGLLISDGMPLLEKAAEESVGARRECVKLGYEMSMCIIFVMPLRSTEEVAEMHQQLLDEKWGRDGSILVAACMKYSFARHYEIAQGIGSRTDNCSIFSFGQGVVEHCGNVQQMVQLFEKQLADQQDFVRSGLVGEGGQYYCYYVAPTYAALELKALHSFGKGLVALLGSWCTDPSECEGCFEESNNWAAWRARYGKGISSKDGLHHLFLKPALISHMQATLSLSLACTGTSNFDLSWLDGLPAANDSKLHDGIIGVYTFVNPRVVIAEVFEWQGRYKEAIRCVHFHAPSYTTIRLHPLPAVQLQLCSSRNTKLLQLHRVVESARRPGSRPMPRCTGGACPLGVGIRCSHRSGEAWAFSAFRGAINPRQGACRPREPRRWEWEWEWAALGRTRGEASAG
jgi:hypothetical protein